MGNSEAGEITASDCGYLPKVKSKCEVLTQWKTVAERHIEIDDQLVEATEIDKLLRQRLWIFPGSARLCSL